MCILRYDAFVQLLNAEYASHTTQIRIYESLLIRKKFHGPGATNNRNYITQKRVLAGLRGVERTKEMSPQTDIRLRYHT